MAKFEIEFTEEVWQRIIIEADSLDDAHDKFWSGDWDDAKPKIYDGEIQENIDISEITEGEK